MASVYALRRAKGAHVIPTGAIHEGHYRPGDVCGDWEIVRFIAAGGIGEVYEVRGVFGGKARRAQAPQRKFQDRSDVVERFGTETRILASISHPYIVSLLHGGRADGRSYIVMEWLDGVSLREFLNFKQAPLPLEIALHYATCIASALEAVYREARVIHRDLKPENILMLKEGGLKVLDFGLGKFVDGDMRVSTSGMSAMFTPHYAAPEQLERRTVDDRTDVYALALIFVEMATGRYPYADLAGNMPDRDLAYANQMLAAPNSLREFAPDAPPVLLDLIDAALQKNRLHRPRSGEFLEGLKAARQALIKPGDSAAPTSARPPVSAPLLQTSPRIVPVTRTQALPAAFTPRAPTASANALRPVVRTARMLEAPKPEAIAAARAARAATLDSASTKMTPSSAALAAPAHLEPRTRLLFPLFLAPFVGFGVVMLGLGLLGRHGFIPPLHGDVAGEEPVKLSGTARTTSEATTSPMMPPAPSTAAPAPSPTAAPSASASTPRRMRVLPPGPVHSSAPSAPPSPAPPNPHRVFGVGETL